MVNLIRKANRRKKRMGSRRRPSVKYGQRRGTSSLISASKRLNRAGIASYVERVPGFQGLMVTSGTSVPPIGNWNVAYAYLTETFTTGIPPAVQTVPYEQNILLTTTAATGLSQGLMALGSVSFRIDDIPLFNLRYQQNWDFYSLSGVKIYFQIDSNTLSVETGDVAPRPPIMYIGPDYDDDTPPIAASSMMSRTDAKVYNFQNRQRSMFSYFIKPKNTMLAQGIAGPVKTITGKHNPWIDCANLDVRHFGLKFAIVSQSGGVAAAATFQFRILCFAKYYFMMKTRRTLGS